MANRKSTVLKFCYELQSKYAHDFPAWVQDFINFDGLKLSGLTWQQEEIAYYLAEQKRVACAAGGGIGKSALAALLTQWFLVTHPHSKIPTTAPSSKQLKDVLWAEIDFWLNRNKLKNLYVRRKDTLHIHSFTEWKAIARTVPKDGKNINDTLAGFHSPYLMILVDESCLDEETEILTNNGWRNIDTIQEYDKPLTKDDLTGVAYHVKPNAIMKYNYEGEMYKYESRTCHFSFSPKHRIAYRKRNPKIDRLTELRLDEIQSFKLNTTPIYMDRYVDFKGIKQDYIEIPEIQTERKFFPKLKIPTNLWCSFMGWYISEGWVVTDKMSVVGISQNDEANLKLITETLDKIGFNYGVYKDQIQIFSKQLALYLAQFGIGAINKTIPKELKVLDKSHLNHFLATFMLGDGYRVNEDKLVFYTSSPQLADDIQEVCVKCGYSTSKNKRGIKGQVKWIKDHWATTNYEGYAILVNIGNQRPIKVRKNNIEKIDYKGRIWCVNVSPTELIYIRKNGKCLWTGNSGVPDPVFTALDGAMTQENSYIFLISNPVSTGGYFYDTITDPEGKGRDYKVLLYSSLDSPLVDPSYEQSIINRYGKDSPMYKSKVLGVPIGLLETALISPEEYDRITTENQLTSNGSVVLGVDPGGKGTDPSVICHKQGKSIIKWDEQHITDDQYLADKIEKIAKGYQAQGKPTTVIVDAIGIGAGVYQLLAKKHGLKVLPFEGSEKAHHATMFKNKRTEGFYLLKDHLSSTHFPVKPPEALKKQLVNLRFDYDNGPIEMEAKKRLKSRIGMSPDHADALMLADSIDTLSIKGQKPLVPKASSNVFKKLAGKRASDKYGKYKKFVV